MTCCRKTRKCTLDAVDAVGDALPIDNESRPAADECTETPATRREVGDDAQLSRRTERSSEPTNHLGARSAAGQNRLTRAHRRTAPGFRRARRLQDNRVTHLVDDAQWYVDRCTASRIAGRHAVDGGVEHRRIVARMKIYRVER